MNILKLFTKKKQDSLTEAINETVLEQGNRVAVKKKGPFDINTSGIIFHEGVLTAAEKKEIERAFYERYRR